MHTHQNTLFDFDEIIDRRNTNSAKWVAGKLRLTPEQVAADPLPMWLADMDFRVAEPIAKALHRAIEMGALGYGITPDAYLEAVVDWQARRFGWHAKPEWVTRSPGVVSALSMVVQAFTQPGDHVLIQTPVYIHFHHDVIINGRRVARAPLSLDETGMYRFDPEAFEAAIVPGTKLFILCNPHNPTGNVWTRDELMTMASICERHGILVVSDEVHQDLVFGDGQQHIPFPKLDHAAAENSIVCTAPSKTFNIAGLQCANIFIPNARLRQAYQAQCEKNGVSISNTMGTAAGEAAYRHGESWVDAMLAYVSDNHRHFGTQVEKVGLPVKVTPTNALYLAWIDFRKLNMRPADLHDFLLRRGRLWLDYGPKFGPEGEGFMRINLACPRSVVDEGLRRLANVLPR
jgi:cystathionine beta-lyase